MEIGTIVKVKIPYKLGEKRIGDRYKIGKVIGIYPNFISVWFKAGYRESFRENELTIVEEKDNGNIFQVTEVNSENER